MMTKAEIKIAEKQISLITESGYSYVVNDMTTELPPAIEKYNIATGHCRKPNGKKLFYFSVKPGGVVMIND